MSVRAAVKPELLRWACERSRGTPETYARRFPHLAAWIRREKQPTLKQLEAFARATHTPIGFFFLSEPFEEPVPIPDFRTIANRDIARPSPDLLDTVYLCQHRQDWYRDYLRTAGEERLPFVGSMRVGDDVVAAAAKIAGTLGFDVDARRSTPTWREALGQFIDLAEEAGILVMVNGVVGGNTHRKLDPDEFRGFALADGLAPLVFVNGADTMAAKTFTLAHELAHIWIEETALTDADVAAPPKQGTDQQATERWCNQVAAELLVPLTRFRGEHDRRVELRQELDRLARTFKVSTLVILRRMHDAGSLRGNTYWTAFNAEKARLAKIDRTKKKGGTFYPTQIRRTSERFSRALIADTLEGNTLYRDAFRMLGIRKLATFEEMSKDVGRAV